jgi:hypothetical protein
MASVPCANAGRSNMPSGPFQTIVRAFDISWLNSSIVFGPMSSPIQPSGVAAMSAIFVAVESGDSASTWSTGSSSRKLRWRASSSSVAGEIELVVFDQRLPYRQPLRFQECVGHGAADQHRVGKLHQILHHFDFVRNLRAAEHGNERALGIRNRLARDTRALFHQQARGGLPHEFRDAHHGGMRAVRRAERVANEKPSHSAASCFENAFVVGFFLG